MLPGEVPEEALKQLGLELEGTVPGHNSLEFLDEHPQEVQPRFQGPTETEGEVMLQQEADFALEAGMEMEEVRRGTR